MHAICASKPFRTECVNGKSAYSTRSNKVRTSRSAWNCRVHVITTNVSLHLSSSFVLFLLRLKFYTRPHAMAGLLSPKPVSYLHQQHNSQYNHYNRSALSAYSETPPLPGAQLAHSIPHQPGQQFLNGTNGVTGNGLSIQDDSKIFALVIDLMDPGMRETALLELSKKREQYDDLALILWHSFGMAEPSLSHKIQLIFSRFYRNYACLIARDRLRLSFAITTKPHRPCFQ